MAKWVLDTDHVSLLQRGHPVVVNKVSTVNPAEIAVTIITIVEQMYGRLDVINRAKSKQELVTAYTLLKETFNLLSQANILDFNEAAFDIYNDLLKQKIRVGTQDLRIASIALAFNCTLVTRNLKDFQKIPNLQIVNWSII
ncbi:type II toxin-antitoxin system VapC family toxin [Calothrix sp. FACHB-1219]|uniref:type II toxin-antitoxin system VapC family toxin n=1 Tax=unclassified Calothrix TaxID=2619626 RepID=UPI001682DBCF|nr:MULTISPECIES: type II toxin-antitoxin system VapC family toxin [unclassified Calothrix]MBD2203623.1 type II toxin-antitoxin system VapC family toxin [Calothrix sp. FACHB-168]MBD2219929.1 type II toxin-antitoxin system VapC family toxin [Calothrix sp. FACHB-1219]